MIDTAATAGTGLTGPIATFAGSTLCGFLCGYALRKILKWLIIIAGVIIGVIFISIQYLVSRGYIHGIVDWTKLGNHAANYGQHILTQVNPASASNSVLHTLGIPVSSGLGVGLLAGFLKG
jgi:uncharacterized membrane protein (Fun14 family)